MTTKAEFNAYEWQKVAEGPALAGLIVIAAERGGTIRESISMAKAYTAAREQHPGGDLLGELVSSPPRIDPKAYESPEVLRTKGLEDLRNALGILEGKADEEEVEAYKRFALTVAERAAEADKSGGVLGIGGKRVSDSERAALQEIAVALGTEPPAAATGAD
jgi:hypothetical protein